MRRLIFCLVISVQLVFAIDIEAVRGDVILKVRDVVVERSITSVNISVPVIAISDDISTAVSGLNVNIDIGGDGQSGLPTGVRLPASLPDMAGVIANGGAISANNWSVVTVHATDGGLVNSDILITSSSRLPATDINIHGDTAANFGNQGLRKTEAAAAGSVDNMC